MNLWVIFVTGLTIGGLTCLAVQGGLLASVIAAKEGEEIKKGINPRNTIFPTLAFLLTKLVVYIILGSMLGAFGGAIGISQEAQIIMQFLAGLYMIAVALNLLNIHPIFRYVIIQPPKFLTRKILFNSFLLFFLIFFLQNSEVRGEYRVYQYYVKSKIPLVQEQKAYLSTSTLDPVSYLSYHGGESSIEIDILRTWMCPGFTGLGKEICTGPYEKILEIKLKNLNKIKDQSREKELK
jgi:cytochrome c biogenesis protein CcdA